jgi:hypothetical protein
MPFLNGKVGLPTTSEAGARWPRFGLVVVATNSRRDYLDQMIRPLYGATTTTGGSSSTVVYQQGETLSKSKHFEINDTETCEHGNFNIVS